MNTAHTPSPWKYRPLPTCDWGVVLCADGFICQAKDPAVTDADLIRHRADRTDPYEANARLIAAAPDMYEALKVARECILNRSNVEYRKHGESTPLQDHYEELIAQIDAAMEKAETP